jgi:hypothetical protein
MSSSARTHRSTSPQPGGVDQADLSVVPLDGRAALCAVPACPVTGEAAAVAEACPAAQAVELPTELGGRAFRVTDKRHADARLHSLHHGQRLGARHIAGLNQDRVAALEAPERRDRRAVVVRRSEGGRSPMPGEQRRATKNRHRHDESHQPLHDGPHPTPPPIQTDTPPDLAVAKLAERLRPEREQLPRGQFGEVNRARHEPHLPRSSAAAPLRPPPGAVAVSPGWGR